MRAASTGGGLVRLVVIRLVVLAAALVMTAAGASSTSAVAAAAASVAASATTAAHKATVPAPPPPPPPPPSISATVVTESRTAAHRAPRNATAACPVDTYELVNVSLRQPPCLGQINEGPGPPYSRCPADRPCGADRSDNNINNNTDNDNNNYNNYDNNNNNNNNSNNNSNHRQCLEYAREELIPVMCPDDPSAYRQTAGRLLRYRLRHCCHHTVESVVQQPYGDAESCRRRVEDAIRMDEFAAAMSCQFNDVLARYDCNQTYSAMTCDSCKEAYALWACAAILPHWTDQQGSRYRVHACKSVCLEVEQKCPWLLPVADDTNPYAGEAAFTCIDPDIWYQTSTRDGEKNCCYEHCGDGGLCVRNVSNCDVGGDCAKQRPVRVAHQDLIDDDSQHCPNYSQYGSSSSGARDGIAAVRRLTFFRLSAAVWLLLARQWGALAVT